MAKMDFTKYGGKCDFLEMKKGGGAPFVETGGGPVDAFGDEEAKEADAIDMNAGEAFNKKDFTKIEAMGTEYPKKGTPGQRSDNKGDHFKVDEVNAYGDDAGKKTSFQEVSRKKHVS